MIRHKEVFNVMGAVALGCLVASSAQAIPITTNGAWSNPQGTAANVNITDDGVGMDNKISWGVEANALDEQSSYVFTGLAAVNVDQTAILAGDLFAVGDFTHNNFTITQGNFTGADLTVNIQVPALGVNIDFGPFEFDHNETPNSPPCDPDGTPPCPDVVSIPTAFEGIPFTFMGMNFEFFLAGFRESATDPIIPEFITDENAENIATLFAGVRKVPEPMTPLLLGLGLLGLGVIRKRKKE